MSDEIWNLMWPVHDEMGSFMACERCESVRRRWLRRGWPRRGDPGLSRLVSPSQELSSCGHQRTDFLLQQQQQGKQHNSGRHQKFVKTARLPGLPLAISISYQEFVDLARIVNFWRLLLHWIYSLLYLHSFLSNMLKDTYFRVFSKSWIDRERNMNDNPSAPSS